jgi:quercetin dioxygenase-like cupin family protein
MDAKKVIDKLKEKYPGKNIVVNTPDNPTEIICEIEPGQKNSDRSVAIAVMDENIRHLHKLIEEKYQVIEGILEINLDGITHILHPGDEITIKPGQIHNAKGKETWVKVTSTPAWTPDDFYKIND